ncbi:MAG: peptide chain release factor 1 [Verrucomicrobiota bacterium]|nr:peptide chain release factor 1 [Verrucomicrobiota bacterium]
MEFLPNIEPFRSRFNELEEKLSLPETFQDNQLATEISREHRRLKDMLVLFDENINLEDQISQCVSLIEDPEMGEEAKIELVSLNKKKSENKEKLLIAMLPPDPEVGKNTIVEIRAGAGGDEASIFAGDLFRMYTRYAEKQGWSVECLSQSNSDTGGFKEVIFILKGEDAWTKMKFESGVHRVQRIPVTEAGGRIHTSTSTVAVLPEAKDVEVSIDPNDLEISVCRASGPGGQGVNTTDSAVQIQHIPSGINVYCADERSQLKNKNKAMTVLRSRLLQKKQSEEKEKYAQNRKDQVGTGDRSERIRTYNYPQSRITDHRVNFTSHALQETMMGELDHLISFLEKEDLHKKLSSLDGRSNE